MSISDATIGEIVRDRLYTLAAIERFGLGKTAMRSLRRRGLIVHRVCKRGFVLGSDLIDAICKQGAQQ